MFYSGVNDVRQFVNLVLMVKNDGDSPIRCSGFNEDDAWVANCSFSDGKTAPIRMAAKLYCEKDLLVDARSTVAVPLSLDVPEDLYVGIRKIWLEHQSRSLSSDIMECVSRGGEPIIKRGRIVIK